LFFGGNLLRTLVSAWIISFPCSFLVIGKVWSVL
jgi:hypothetical protein